VSEALHEGGCLCGGVRYRAVGELRPVLYCHCRQCRRTHGHFAAYTAVAREGLALTADTTLCWYESTPGIRRGFCSGCGASLFWERVGGAQVGIAAGTLDEPTGLNASGHIFMADAGDYYVIDDGLPQHPQSDDGLRIWPPPATRVTDDGDPAG
jgi:hypothetical protein